MLVSLAEILLLIPVAILALGKYKAGWSALGLRRFKAGVVGIGCGLMILFYGINLAYSLFLGLFNLRVQTDMVPVFRQLSSPVWFLIGGAIVAPVVEEIFFRGFIFGGLRTRYSFPIAAVISALLFGLVHLEWTAILPITLLGLIFALLIRTQRIHLAGDSDALPDQCLFFKRGILPVAAWIRRVINMTVHAGIPKGKQKLLGEITGRLSQVPGMVAVVLGGSYARGTQHRGSDLDLGLYYAEAEPFSITDIRGQPKRSRPAGPQP